MTVERQSGYRVHDWGAVPVWEEFERPRPGPGEVLVQVEACGVGLTVLNCINGDLANDPTLLPRVPGHEFAGRVIDAGPGADRDLIGRRVVPYFYLSCGACPECRAGRDSLCRRLRGWVGVHVDGGYAPFAVLPAHNAVPVPEELDPVAATVVPDAVATPVHVCGTRARVRPQDRVAVIGAGGGVGIHMVQVAMLFGARVAALDVDDGKLAALEELGATPVRSDRFASIDAAGLWSQGAPTVVIDLLGSAESLAWASGALAPGGRLVLLTTFRGLSIDVDPREMVFGETTVLGTRYAARAELDLAAGLVADGRIRPVVGQVVAPGDVLDLHEQLRQGRLLGRGAIRWR